MYSEMCSKYCINYCEYTLTFTVYASAMSQSLSFGFSYVENENSQCRFMMSQNDKLSLLHLTDSHCQIQQFVGGGYGNDLGISESK